MNRSIALFVALVLLLAHILAIHNDGEGYFAYPYDQAYVALRLAKNLVVEGELRWNLGTSAFESYPSMLWVGVAAIGERLAIAVTTVKVHLFLQMVGVLSVLFTVIMAAHFRADRAAGLIAPLLLVTSGSVAAAAASGLETALLMLTIVASFWSLERGYSRRFALALTACVLVRPEGIVIVIGLLALRLLERARAGSSPSNVDKQLPLDANRPAKSHAGSRALWPFAFPVLAVAGEMFVRHGLTGAWLSPTLATMIRPHTYQWVGGLLALRDFVIVTVSLLLLVYPLIYFVRRRLSTLGMRALFLAILWFAMCVWQGRSPLPFGENMAPALPLIFLAIQEGMIEALDGTWRAARRMALLALVVCLGGSALASKVPGRIGPVTPVGWHEAWMRPSGSARYGFEAPLGRLGIIEEIEHTRRMRALGMFMGEELEPGSSVLTPWPGIVGYLSRLRVVDLLGRTNPMPDTTKPAAWTRREHADVVAALEANPDYVVPWIESGNYIPTMPDIARTWFNELDVRSTEPGRLPAIERALREFELITVPLAAEKRGTAPRRSDPFLLLRRRDLDQRPKLRVAIDGEEARVEVRHASHQQLVDLSIQAVDERARTWWMRPNGDMVQDARVRARVEILLYDTGTRTIELARFRVPETIEGSRLRSLRAVLRNPRSMNDHLYALASDEAVHRFE
jgi:hypothetical protein